jgi:leucyl/phenylalanyl-tRNA--protein transferase
MPVYRLGPEIAFPPPERAHPSGLLAVGGDLSPERLLLAYSMGIFPWYERGQPILWHSPDPRFVLLPAELHVPRRLERTIRQERFELRFDTAFASVLRGCAEGKRREGPGTWLTAEMITAYTTLHELGVAHSAEAWREGELAGGVYGVAVGSAFSAESMFTRVSDAGKVALVALVRRLERAGCPFVDCQVHTDNLARFGAREWPRERYLAALAEALKRPAPTGRW